MTTVTASSDSVLRGQIETAFLSASARHTVYPGATTAGLKQQLPDQHLGAPWGRGGTGHSSSTSFKEAEKIGHLESQFLWPGTRSWGAKRAEDGGANGLLEVLANSKWR